MVQHPKQSALSALQNRRFHTGCQSSYSPRDFHLVTHRRKPLSDLSHADKNLPPRHCLCGGFTKLVSNRPHRFQRFPVFHGKEAQQLFPVEKIQYIPPRALPEQAHPLVDLPRQRPELHRATAFPAENQRETAMAALESQIIQPVTAVEIRRGRVKKEGKQHGVQIMLVLLVQKDLSGNALHNIRKAAVEGQGKHAKLQFVTQLPDILQIRNVSFR